MLALELTCLENLFSFNIFHFKTLKAGGLVTERTSTLLTPPQK